MGELLQTWLNILHLGLEGETHEWRRQALQGKTVVCELCGFVPAVKANEIYTTADAGGNAVGRGGNRSGGLGDTACGLE